MASRLFSVASSSFTFLTPPSTRISILHNHHHRHHNNNNNKSFLPFPLRLRSLPPPHSSTSPPPPPVYQGLYGPWSVDSVDVREVILYRSGLVTSAASVLLAGSLSFFPNASFLNQYLDFIYAIGAAGLGVSLFLIHIYVTEIKRSLQLLWALGVVGSSLTYINLAHPSGHTLIQYVIDNPIAVWFVGPLFAALTGLVFKEGLCYGKLEAGLLTFIIPILLLGHLSGLMDDGVKSALLDSWMALFVVFAGRKFTQPIKDDIGDKSVFIFQALPEKEKQALIEKLEQQKFVDNLN